MKMPIGKKHETICIMDGVCFSYVCVCQSVSLFFHECRWPILQMCVCFHECSWLILHVFVFVCVCVCVFMNVGGLSCMCLCVCVCVCVFSLHRYAVSHLVYLTFDTSLGAPFNVE